MTTITNRTRVLALTALVAASGLLLTGCTPEPVPTTTPTSSPTPTPTASTVPAPESESDAVDSAEYAIAQYLQIRGEVNKAGGTDTTPLETIATGPALKLAVDDAGRISAGFKTEGAIVFAPTTAYAVDLVAQDGTTFPFSSVNVTGCQDATNYKIFNADGTPAQQPDVKTNIFEFNVIWEPTIKNWLVNTAIFTGETC